MVPPPSPLAGGSPPDRKGLVENDHTHRHGDGPQLDEFGRIVPSNNDVALKIKKRLREPTASSVPIPPSDKQEISKKKRKRQKKKTPVPPAPASAPTAATDSTPPPAQEREKSKKKTRKKENKKANHGSADGGSGAHAGSANKGGDCIDASSSARAELYSKASSKNDCASSLNVLAVSTQQSTPGDPRPCLSEGKKARWSEGEKKYPPRNATDIKPLIILDLNGILCHRIRDRNLPKRTVFRPSIGHIANTAVVPRSDLREFVTLLHENFFLAVWTSATPKTARRLVKELFPENIRNRLVFVWHRHYCDLIDKTETDKSDIESLSTSEKNENGTPIDADTIKKGGTNAYDQKGSENREKLSVHCSKENELNGNGKGHHSGFCKEEGKANKDHIQLPDGRCKEEGSTSDRKGGKNPNMLSEVGGKKDGTNRDNGHVPGVGCKELGLKCYGKNNGISGNLLTSGHKEEVVSNTGATLSAGGCKECSSNGKEGNKEKLSNEVCKKEEPKANKKEASKDHKILHGDCKKQDSSTSNEKGNGDNVKLSEGSCRGSTKCDGNGNGNTCKPSELGCKKEPSSGDVTITNRKGKKKKSHKDVTAIKSLSKVWSRYPRWNATNTILIDDSPEKCPRQFRGNAVHPPPICGTVTHIEEYKEGVSESEIADVHAKAGIGGNNCKEKACLMVDNDEVNQKTQRNFFELLARQWATSPSLQAKNMVGFLAVHARDYNMGWQMSQLQDAKV